jgi:hypothetical protein
VSMRHANTDHWHRYSNNHTIDFIHRSQANNLVLFSDMSRRAAIISIKEIRLVLGRGPSRCVSIHSPPRLPQFLFSSSLNRPLDKIHTTRHCDVRVAASALLLSGHGCDVVAMLARDAGVMHFRYVVYGMFQPLVKPLFMTLLSLIVTK